MGDESYREAWGVGAKVSGVAGGSQNTWVNLMNYNVCYVPSQMLYLLILTTATLPGATSSLGEWYNPKTVTRQLSSMFYSSAKNIEWPLWIKVCRQHINFISACFCCMLTMRKFILFHCRVNKHQYRKKYGLNTLKTSAVPGKTKQQRSKDATQLSKVPDPLWTKTMMCYVELYNVGLWEHRTLGKKNFGNIGHLEHSTLGK